MRDLDYWVVTDRVPHGIYCDHSRMREHCPGCGHFECPCGLEWDDGAFGGRDLYTSTSAVVSSLP